LDRQLFLSNHNVLFFLLLFNHLASQGAHLSLDLGAELLLLFTQMCHMLCCWKV
jgi:hypothetical protein